MTSSLPDQHVTGLTGTDMSNLQVLTVMLAPAVVDETLVDPALVLGLVLPRAAVVLAVAEAARADAHRSVARAVELADRRVAPQVRVACNWMIN